MANACGPVRDASAVWHAVRERPGAPAGRWPGCGWAAKCPDGEKMGRAAWMSVTAPIARFRRGVQWFPAYGAAVCAGGYACVGMALRARKVRGWMPTRQLP